MQYSSNFCLSEKYLSEEPQMLSVVYDQFEFQSLCVLIPIHFQNLITARGVGAWAFLLILCHPSLEGF